MFYVVFPFHYILIDRQDMYLLLLQHEQYIWSKRLNVNAG